METLKDFVWPIVAIGGLGAFIDFLIGKTGQARAKDFLLRWWVRFDDVRWRNFGREEGLYAGRLIERWFGHKIWCWQRVIAAAILYGLFLFIGLMRNLLLSSPDTFCSRCDSLPGILGTILGLALLAFFYFIGFSISVSFTKFITFGMARLCGKNEIRNIIVFLVTLDVNYVVLVIWFPIMQIIKFSPVLYLPKLFELKFYNTHKDMGHFLWGMIDYILLNYGSLYPKLVISELKETRGPIAFAFALLTVFPTLLRFILSIIVSPKATHNASRLCCLGTNCRKREAGLHGDFRWS